MYTLENIAGNYGISISSNNYVVVRKTLFTSKTEGVEPYFKEMPFGYYGTLDQALIGLRKFYLRDDKDGLVKEGELVKIDEYISRVQQLDEDMKMFLADIVINMQFGGIEIETEEEAKESWAATDADSSL